MLVSFTILAPLLISPNVVDRNHVANNQDQFDQIVNTVSPIANIYEQKQILNEKDHQSQKQEEHFSTLQTLLFIIPLLLIPAIVIFLVFYKKNRTRKQIKNDKK